MRCFKSNKPNLSAQDVIENKKNRIIYKHNVERIKTKAKNFDGTISYDLTNNSIKQTGSYKKLLSLHKGKFLCKDCGSVKSQPSLSTSNFTKFTSPGGNLIEFQAGGQNANSTDTNQTNTDWPTVADMGHGSYARALNHLLVHDPDNIISKGKHLNYVTVEGDNPGGDTTIATYMRKFSYPKNIILE